MPSETLPFNFDRPPPPPEPPPPPPKPEELVLSVGDLDRAIRTTIDTGFARPVLVEGEVTGARPAASGHVYFSLKDEREDASIDVVIYRTSLSNKGRELIFDGARIRLRGRPTFWAPRGRLQFIADRVLPAGRGALLEALERLKEKLQAEGLFRDDRKRALPPSPRVIGVVTSAHGAAIHDICRVAFQRGGAHILLAPALVQGAGAAASMKRALELLSRVNDVSVIIVGRGGGAAEDLAAFNDESFVRAVSECPIPVVSAVGHETDVTLTDLVADARAATPSQAAELLVADVRAQREAAQHLESRLRRSVKALLNQGQLELGRAQRRIQDPRLLLSFHQQTLDDLHERLATSMRKACDGPREELVKLERLLAVRHPKAVVERQAAARELLAERLSNAFQVQLRKRERQLGELGGRLHAMSPLSVLGRGYAIVKSPRGRAVRSVADVSVGETVQVRVHHADLVAVVTGVSPVPAADEQGTTT